MNDPLVDEIHRIREQLLEEAGGDIEKLMDRLKACEAEDRSRVVSDVPGPRQVARASSG
jgi:hypothetical protein